MTSSSQADLILLIRLLYDDLSAPEGASVREKLADSRQFADKYHALNAARNTPLRAVDRLARIDSTDVDRVARFVDGSLSPRQRDEFETECWRLPSLLHEVIATWRATRQPDTTVVPPVGFSDRMIQFIRPASAPDIKATAAEHRHLLDLRRRLRHPPPTSRRGRADSSPRHCRQAKGWTAAAVALGFVAATTLAVLLTPDRQSDGLNADRVVRNQWPARTSVLRENRPILPAPPDAENDAVPEDRPVAENIPPKSPTGVPVDHLPAVADRAQQRPDAGSVTTDPVPMNGPLPATDSVDAISRWRNITGVVAVRSGDQTQWHGVHSDQATAAMTDSLSEAILTFAGSQASADLSGGGQLTLGTETLVHAASETTWAEDAADYETVNEVRLEYGRVAVVGLTGRQRLRIVAGDQVLDIRSAGRRADFTVEQSSGAILCAVRNGSVEINDTRASSDNWVQFGSTRPISVEPRPDSFRWIDGPPPGQEIPKQICETLNRAVDIPAETRALLASHNPQISNFATRTLLDLEDASDPHTLPEAFIRRQLEAASEARRVALVQWILSALQRRPERADAVWSTVFRSARHRTGIQTPRLTNADLNDLRQTYHSAIQRVSPDISQVRKLIQQLQPAHHVFVRQSAKFFLEQILEEQLPEYDPLNPSSRAISSVIQKLRRWNNARK